MSQTANLGLPLWGETPPEGATGLALRNAILGENEDSMAQVLDKKVERLANKVTEITDDVADEQYPSAQAVKKYVDGKKYITSWNELEDRPFHENEDGSVTKLDEKYLPDNLVTETKLNEALENFEVPDTGVSSWNDLTDKPFGEETTEEVVIEKFALWLNNGSGLLSYSVSSGVVIVSEATYKILWGADEYTCTAYELNGAVVLGNPSISDAGDDTGEPFFVTCTTYDDTVSEFQIVTTDTTLTSIDFAISKITTSVTQLDEKYLPDALVNETELEEALSGILPEVTEEDNNKFLRVVAGKWTAQQYSPFSIERAYSVSSKTKTVFGIEYTVQGSEMSQMVKRGTYTDLLERPFGEIPAIFVCGEGVGTKLALSGRAQIFGKLGLDTTVAPLCKSASIENVAAPVIGASYTFTLGGVAYPCTAKRVYDIGENYHIEDNKLLYYFGNWGLTGFQSFGSHYGEDTGEPFLIFWQQGNCAVYVTNECYDTLPSDYSTTASLVPANEYFKIDEKYLPDNMFGGVSSWNDLTDKPFGDNEDGSVTKLDEKYLPDNLVTETELKESQANFITAADVAAMLASAGVIEPVAVEDNLLLTDSEDDIYIL